MGLHTDLQSEVTTVLQLHVLTHGSGRCKLRPTQFLSIEITVCKLNRYPTKCSDFPWCAFYVIQVLRPYSNIANLKIWDYYLSDGLAHGSPYDLEIVEREMSLDEEQQCIDAGPQLPNSRRLLNACYDDIHQLQPDSCTFLLQVSSSCLYFINTGLWV